MFEKTKINEKETGVGPFFLKKYRAIRLIAAGGGQEAIVVALYSEDPSSNPVEA